MSVSMDWKDLKLPPEYQKPFYVVPDNQVEAWRIAFGDMAEIIPLSETMLPVDMPTDSISAQRNVSE